MNFAGEKYYFILDIIGRLLRKMKIYIFKMLYPKFLSSIMYETPKVYFLKNLYIGKKIHFNSNIFIHAAGNVYIGDYSILSHGVSILSTSLKIHNWSNRNLEIDEHVTKKVVIGKNVWLCANVTVLQGVKIANNIVVGAGSVVASDLLEENCLYVGIPAKKIRSLS